MIRNLGAAGVTFALIGAFTLFVAVLTSDFHRCIIGALFILLAGYEYRLRERERFIKAIRPTLDREPA